MSKIVKNTTASPYDINDVGVTVPASNQITIDPQDYLLYAGSDDVIVGIGSGDLVINDGSSDLSINDGTKLIQGIFPNPVGISGPTGTQIGNDKDRLKTSALIEDTDGGRLQITNFSELLVSNRKIALETKFYYNINTISLTTDNANGGTISVVNRQAVLSTGTNSAGKAFLRTKSTVDYRVSQTIEASATFVFPEFTGTPGSQTGPANCRFFMGLFDESENDGIRFGYDSTVDTGFILQFIRSGTITSITQDSFNRDRLDGSTIVNGETSEYAPDWTKLQLIRIIYSWHGTAPVLWQIQKPNGAWRTFHIQTFINVSVVSNIGTPVLPYGALIENQGSTLDNVIDWQAGQVSILGNSEAFAGIRNFEQRREVASTANQQPLITIRNKITYQSQTNFINAVINWVSCSADGNRFTSFTLYKNATLTGASFSDKDATNSIMEVDTSATSFTGTDEIITITVGESNSFNRNIEDLNLELVPGDAITIVANTGGSTDTTFALRWGERH